MPANEIRLGNLRRETWRSILGRTGLKLRHRFSIHWELWFFRNPPTALGGRSIKTGLYSIAYPGCSRIEHPACASRMMTAPMFVEYVSSTENGPRLAHCPLAPWWSGYTDRFCFQPLRRMPPSLTMPIEGGKCLRSAEHGLLTRADGVDNAVYATGWLVLIQFASTVGYSLSC